MEDYPIVLDLSAMDRMTDEQFFNFCVNNKALRIERNADGTITIVPPAGFESSDLTGEVLAEIKCWARQARIGVATESSAGFRLQDQSVRAADVAWISDQRLLGISLQDRKQFIPACPNFIVEVATATDQLPALRRKMDNWIANGVELGWLINPKNETVEIYEQGKAPVTVTGFDQTLSGLDYLPGFEFDLCLLRR